MADMEKADARGESNLFAAYRAIGLVTNNVPFCLQARGTENFVTTVVGRSFHTYNCVKLNLRFVGEIQKDNISAITAGTKFIIASVGQKIKLFDRGRQACELSGHQNNIKHLMTYANILVSIDEGNEVKIWDLNGLEEYITLVFDKDSFEVSTVIHPATYLNKVLFGSYQGSLQLWNIKTNKLLFTFSGWSSAVVTLEQAPALDVMAIGLSSGDIYLHNIRYDETVMKFSQEFGPALSIVFRTDGVSYMATGSPSGHITIWDLEKNSVCSVIRMAHVGAVHSLRFLMKQPILLSGGDDNSLRMWIFDNPDGSARLLRARGGHSSAVTHLNFYGPSGHIIVSAGLDRALRFSSIVNDSQSCEFSQGSLESKAKLRGVPVENLRLSPVTSFDLSLSREKHWDNVVTCHSGSAEVRTWSVKNRRLGLRSLKMKTRGRNGSVAVAVKISSSGHFAMVGYSSGQVEIFNLQSGLHRGSLVDCSANREGKIKEIQESETEGKGCNQTASKYTNAHSKAVRGLAIDCADVIAISGSADKTIKFWWFQKRMLADSIQVTSPVRSMLLQQDSSLLAVALDDFSISIFDIETRKLVRTFQGHSNVINSIAFSGDGRWLISASMDSTVRVWNIPSARLIDHFLFDVPVTSLVLSPTNEFLATSHLDDPAIYLWSNKTLYGLTYSTPLPNDSVPVPMDLPHSHVECQDETMEEITLEENKEEQDSNDVDPQYESPDQLGEQLVTLSLLPESRWRSLVHLDVIKSRNKPKQPPQKPKQAPFFLTTIPGLEPTFVAGDDNTKVSNGSKVGSRNLFEADSEFLSLLKDFSQTGLADSLMNYLKNLSPSLMDVEIRSLHNEFLDNRNLQFFLKFLKKELVSGRDFELVQGIIGLFIKHHGGILSESKELTVYVSELLGLIDSSWFRCEEMINQSLCLLNYFKSITL